MAGAALFAPVSGLVGMGLGAVIRHSATTIVTGMVLLLLLPVALSGDHYWTAVVGHAMPYQVWGQLMASEGATFSRTTGRGRFRAGCCRCRSRRCARRAG